MEAVRNIKNAVCNDRFYDTVDKAELTIAENLASGVTVHERHIFL